jgi:hypothetical protein
MSDKKIIAVVGATGAHGGGLLRAIPASRRGNVGHRVAGPSALRDVNPLVQVRFEDFGLGSCRQLGDPLDQPYLSDRDARTTMRSARRCHRKRR